MNFRGNNWKLTDRSDVKRYAGACTYIPLIMALELKGNLVPSCPCKNLVQIGPVAALTRDKVRREREQFRFHGALWLLAKRLCDEGRMAGKTVPFMWKFTISTGRWLFIHFRGVSDGSMFSAVDFGYLLTAAISNRNFAQRHIGTRSRRVTVSDRHAQKRIWNRRVDKYFQWKFWRRQKRSEFRKWGRKG